MKATALANSNIAIIKYWGKKDEKLILPMNNSISFTMDEQLSTVTTVEFDKELKNDDIVLDGMPGTEREVKRVNEFLNIVRTKTRINAFARIVSKNSFPKAAGLASSASGFAALAAAASKAAGLELSDNELSILARHGSGSACRSIYGGAVEWLAGYKKDGGDSYAVQLSDESNWKNLRNIIAIIDLKEKKVSSRIAMAETVRTSKRFKQRLIAIEKRLETVRNAIKNSDFESMIGIIMEDSDDMHACMADTVPPINYLNETSHRIIRAIRNLNEKEKIAAYTFDAGPNANVYTTERHVNEIKKILSEIDGVKKIIECKIGRGIRFRREHLF